MTNGLCRISICTLSLSAQNAGRHRNIREKSTAYSVVYEYNA